ncbi:hypothetical protein [Microbacterium xylanilyticum]
MLETILAAATATPTPTPTVDPNLVTPGPVGFVIVAVVVVFAALLIWDMQRRIRRVRYREEVRAELDAEEAAARGETAPDAGEDGPKA